jgi:hypothetical protein
MMTNNLKTLKTINWTMICQHHLKTYLFRFLASIDHGDQAVIAFSGHSQINVIIMLLGQHIDLGFKSVLYGCEAWSFTSRMFQIRVLRRIFGPKMD